MVWRLCSQDRTGRDRVVWLQIWMRDFWKRHHIPKGEPCAQVSISKKILTEVEWLDR